MPTTFWRPSTRSGRSPPIYAAACAPTARSTKPSWQASLPASPNAKRRLSANNALLKAHLTWLEVNRMASSLAAFLPHVNDTRYHAQPNGHYESFFQRANHPSRPLAFWIRYTIFSPKHHPEEAVGELWAIFFNGETGNHVVVKQVVPFSGCTFSPSAFQVQIAGASLQQGQLHGALQGEDASLAWDLAYRSEQAPLLLLPLRLYATRLPAAKSLVGAPLATYEGKLVVNGETIDVHQWVGSQNHNWGSKHTDLYAWGQVAGFDTHPDSFLEVATARLKLGAA